jgi:hypothetical protein
MPDLADLLYIVFLALVVWLAIKLWDDGDGGGWRGRIPIVS